LKISSVRLGIVLVMTISLSSPALALKSIKASGDFDANILRIDEGKYLGTSVPDVEVRTSAGPTYLLSLIGEDPALVLLAYYTCGHVCPASIQGLADLKLEMDTDTYKVIVLSFDKNDNLMTMNHVKGTLDRVPDNWTFGLLTESASTTLTEALGYKFFFSEKDQTFVHPAAAVFLSPRGEVMRYLYGTELVPEDVELALIESRDRKPRLGEIVDMVRLTCFQFDRSRSRYVLHPALIFGGAGFGVLGLAGIAAFAYKKEPEGEL